MTLCVAVNYVDYKELHKREAQEIALSVMACNAPLDARLCVFVFEEDNVEVPERFEVHKTLKLNSKDILGNDRTLPYVKEIMDQASDFNEEAFLFVNSDILLSRDFFKHIRIDIDVHVFYRIEICKTTLLQFNENKFKRYYPVDWHSGNDGFLFRTVWWKNNRNKFPDDLILGETEWDTCYRTITQHETPRHFLTRSLYHFYHDALWTLISKGALNNIRIWQDIKKRYGI